MIFQKTDRQIEAFVSLPKLHPILLLGCELLDIGRVMGVWYVPGGGFKEVLQFLGLEYVAPVGKGQVL